MAIAISSAGIKVSYAVESTAGTMPTADYKHIPGIKEIPDMNPAPSSLETTTLDNLDYKTYINGLKDIGGALEFTANFTQELLDLWNGTDASSGVVGEYNTAVASGKAVWLCVDIPGLNKSTFFTFEPSLIGLTSASVDSILETPLYITPTSEPKWEENPTYATV